MWKKILSKLGPFFGILLFAAVLWVLHLSLKEYRTHDILQALETLPKTSVLLACGLTALNYLFLGIYESLAFRYIDHPLKYKKIALASFIGYAFSNSAGFAMISGSSVRFRLYAAWGLSAGEIVNVVTFSLVAFWLGLLTLAGIVFLLEPIAIPSLFHLPTVSAHFLGAVSLSAVGLYLFLSFKRKTPVKIRELEFTLPSVPVSVAQILISSVDWILAASVLYVLLPAGGAPSFPFFIGIFLLAQIAGLISQIPGGFGVFETVFIVLLSPFLPAPGVAGALFAYRGIYYLLPLCAAAVLLGLHEVIEKKRGVTLILKMFGQWVPELAPTLLAFTTFIGGAVLLFSGATPAIGARMVWLQNTFPLPVIEISHFLGSLAGAELLFLAFSLQRRLDAAYPLTILALAGGIIFSLLKGFDYEEALVLSALLAALLPCRKYFYRKTSLIEERFTPSWMIAVALVFLCSVWLGFFSFKHIEYSHDLWWRFALFESAPRFLRATVGVVGLMLFVGIARLLHPAQPEPVLPTPADLDKARRIIGRFRKTNASLALLGDKEFLFSKNEEAFLMYAIHGRSWIALGDPIGQDTEKVELAWRFRELCDRHDGRTVFYDVGKDYLHLYLDLGLTLIKSGEEARVPLPPFTLVGNARKELRHTYRYPEKEGFVFEMILPEKVPTVWEELKRVSDAWLREKNTKEKGFSIGFFDPDYLKQFPVAVIRKENKIAAFANVWLGADKEELSVDLMRYSIHDAPRGVMDALFVHLMLWGQAQGYQWFNLGVAPLSGLQDRALAPLWNRLGALVFRHGEHFYNFQGLRQYKEKFDPVWEPKYLACPGGLVLAQILTDLAALISGGLKGIIAK